MAENRNIVGRKGGDQDLLTGHVRGIAERAGIVVGVVKDNSHPSRLGVINVFVPEFGLRGLPTTDPSPSSTGSSKGGGELLEDDPKSWRQVSFCTPFYSRVENTGLGTDDISVKNTAGLVFPSPDIGTKVLCFFPEGRNDGYWFACIPDDFMLQALPESSYKNKTGNVKLDPNISRDPELAPGLDFNDRRADTYKIDNWIKEERALDKTTAGFLKAQGIDKDRARGPSTSSYMRETPSELFGITTKGRKVNKNKQDIKDTTIPKELLSGKKPADMETLLGKVGRKKGHTFVMDDGDLEGVDQLVRLRTSTGHQILMNDTEGFVYVINSSGTGWVELNNNGTIDVYGQDSINIRSKNIQFHADQSFKVHAKSQIQLVSEGSIHIEGSRSASVMSEKGKVQVFGGGGLDLRSGSALNLQGSIVNMKGSGHVNIKGACIALQGPAAGASKPNAIPLQTKKDTRPDGKGFWNSGTPLKTTVDRAPTHEPFADHKTSKTEAIQKKPVSKKPAETKKAKTEISSLKIKPGDTLTKIAKENGTTVDALMKANPNIKDPNKIFAGDTLNLPGATLAQDGKNKPTIQSITTTIGGGTKDLLNPKNVIPVLDDGLDIIKKLPNSQTLDPVSIIKQPFSGLSIGKLASKSIQAIAAQVGDTVSGLTHDFVDPVTNAVGKFGFNVDHLKRGGFVRPETVFNGQLTDPKVWTGQLGIGGLADFKVNDVVQENLFNTELFDTYQSSILNGAIQDYDSEETVAGLLTAGFAAGPENVLRLREGDALVPRPLVGTGTLDTSQFQNEVINYYHKGESAVVTSKQQNTSTTTVTGGGSNVFIRDKRYEAYDRAVLQAEEATDRNRRAAIEQYKKDSGLSGAQALRGFTKALRDGNITYTEVTPEDFLGTIGV
jgi:LysM repeat protein